MAATAPSGGQPPVAGSCEARRVVLTLELSCGDEHVAGTLAAAGEQARPFAGWLELLSMLELRAHPDQGRSS